MLFPRRALALAANFLVLSSVPTLQVAVGGDTRPYVVATLLIAALNLALVVSWKNEPAIAHSPRHVPLVMLGTSVVAVAMTVTVCAIWIRQILFSPHDPYHADMLIVVQQGISRVLQGKNPYTIYHVPWDAPLPYGPMLWAPFIIPYLLRADIRFVSIAGELFVPVACAIAAVSAGRRGWQEACGWTLVLAAIGFNPDLERFAVIGHTPAYWPLLALFAWLVARERWSGGAVAMGLLIGARTTMVALAPLFLMTVWWRARPRLARATVLMLIATVLPFLPFIVWDRSALWYAMYGSYEKVMKQFVWPSTTWVQHSIGVTGLLLANGWQRGVEIVQALAMVAVYTAAGRAIKRGAPAVPWMALALLAFSATTLWPVIYIYFDVFFLLVCAALAQSRWISSGRRPLGAWSATLAAVVLLIVTVAWVVIPSHPSVDVGASEDRRSLRSGFGGDERDGIRTFVWVRGPRALIVFPRRSWRGAMIDIECERPPLLAGANQHVSAVLNGTRIGEAVATSGWSRILFFAPARAWQIGVNELELFVFSDISAREAASSQPREAASSQPREASSDDHLQPSLAIDRIDVRTR